MLILPTVNAFARKKQIGLLNSLKKQSEKGVRAGMLVPVTVDKKNEQDILDLAAHRIQVNRLSLKPMQEVEAEANEKGPIVTVVIADNRTSLVIERENDEKDDFVGAVGLAILSMGKALALSYARIFESLWLETRLTAKLAESDKLQKEFINIAAHELRTPITPILA